MKCCQMHAGLLRHTVSVEGKTRVSDDAGGYTIEWVEKCSCRAGIIPRHGTEQQLGMQTEAHITHDIVMRYRDDIDQADRIVYDGRVFNIISVIDIEERKRWLDLRCEEGTAYFQED